MMSIIMTFSHIHFITFVYILRIYFSYILWRNVVHGHEEIGLCCILMWFWYQGQTVFFRMNFVAFFPFLFNGKPCWASVFFFFNVGWNSTWTPSRPGHFLFCCCFQLKNCLLITVAISLFIIDPFKLFIFSWFNFVSPHVSRYVLISYRFSNLWEFFLIKNWIILLYLCMVCLLSKHIYLCVYI